MPRPEAVLGYPIGQRHSYHQMSPQQIWVNPDCGLKTRRWKEVSPSLQNMVEAARSLRTKFSATPVSR